MRISEYNYSPRVYCALTHGYLNNCTKLTTEERIWNKMVNEGVNGY